MNDLSLIRDLRPEPPLATSAELAPARSALLEVSTSDTVVAGPRSRRRFGLVAAGATVGVAAGLAAVLALTSGPGPGVVEPAPALVLTAADVLHNAARHARQLTEPAPRADQFVYLRSQDGPQAREEWLSVDGTHDGRVVIAGGESFDLPGCVNGARAVIKGDQRVPGMNEPCTAEGAYRSDLPTDATAMRAYLSATNDGQFDLNASSKNALSLARAVMPAAARAALFEAVSQFPGIVVVPDAVDASGRHGIGISWSTPDHRSGDFIFEPDTYQLLGGSAFAILRVAIVDAVGQHP